MKMRTLNILVCGTDAPVMQGLTRMLVDEGVLVKFSDNLLEDLSPASQDWDFLLIDFSNLSSHTRNLLPIIRRRFPNLQLIGISPKSLTSQSTLIPLSVDAHYSEIPAPEELIVTFPRIAMKYLA
jgi:hypothetical protein